MKRNKKFYRRLAAAAAAVIVCTVFTVAGRVGGNPLIKLYLENKTEKYLLETYPQHSLEITDCRYFGGDMFGFEFSVKDKQIKDVEFNIRWYDKGREMNDSYPYTVANMKNTYNRLSEALAQDAAGILSEHSGFVDIAVAAAYGDWGREIFTGYPEEYGIYMDMVYDREKINVPVTIYLTQKERPADTDFDDAVKAAQVAYEMLCKNGISPKYISVNLSVNCGDYYCVKGGRIECSQLYSVGLAERLYNGHLNNCKKCMTDRGD